MLIQIAFLAALALYCGWSAADALRSGRVSLYVRYNRDRHFSRRANPAGYWTVVGLYLMFAAAGISGVFLRFYLATTSS
jgi:hypothetical protein